MSIVLRVCLIIVCSIGMIYIVNMIAKNKINLKYAIIWFMTGFCLLIMAILPQIPEYISLLLGFKVVSNAVFLFSVAFLFLISIQFTVALSRQNDRIRKLAQEVAIRNYCDKQ